MQILCQNTLAKEHGISVSIPSKSSKPAVPSGAISEGNALSIPSAPPAEGMEGTEETEGPTITDTLPYPLPDFLQKVIAPKTAEKYISAWCKGGQLVRVAQGKYEKSG